MSVMMRDGGGYTSPPAPPPPPPPPTPASLRVADSATANASIVAMTPPQQADFQTAVVALPQHERTDLLNDLATKLEPAQLVAIEPVFGQPQVREAVETRSSASVRDGYLQPAGTPADTPATKPAVDDQVKQAGSDYQEKVAGMGLPAQALMTTLMAEHVDQPAYLAEVVRLAKEDGTLDQAVNPMGGGLYARDGADYQWGNEHGMDGDVRRAAFETAVGAALDRGTLNQADIRAFGAYSTGWQDVAAKVGVGQVGVTDATIATSADLDGLLDTQGDAVEDATRLDKAMGGLLGQAGPLTAAQQSAFIEAYRNDPENKPTYDKLIESNAALADYTKANGDAMLDAAVRDPEVAQQVHDSIVALANNGHGVQALGLLAEVQKVPDSAIGMAFADFDDLSGDVLTNAASSAMSELLSTNNGSVSAAQAQFTTLMAAFGQGVPAWGGYKDVSNGASLMTAFADGNYRAVDLYAKQFNEAKPLFRAFAAGGVVLGSVTAINAGSNEQYALAISGLAQTGENGARLVSGAMTNLALSGRIAQYTDTFAGVGGFASRLAPGLGLIASSASLVNSVDQASDGNVGYAVAAVGDVLGVMGSALELFPVSAPAGFLVSGIGAIVSGLGSFAGEIINGNERREDIARYLTAAGVDPAVVDEMADVGSQLFDMANALDMDAGQVQALLAARPDVALSPGHVGVFTDTAKALGLHGDEVRAFADKMAQDDSNFSWELFGVATGTGQPTSPEQRAAFLRSQVEIRFPSASDYAASVSPELFGAAAEQREQAVRDFEISGNSMSWELSVGNLLIDNSEPAYRAEVIKQLDGEGRLDAWARNLGGYGGDWADAAKAALADAVASGIIDQAKADTVLPYFG